MIRPATVTFIRRATTVVLATLAIGACGVAGRIDSPGAPTPPKPVSHGMQAASGAVQLELPIADPHSVPIGPFTLTEGGDLLGCDAGTFAQGMEMDGAVSAVLTCDDGPRSGTFVLSFEPVAAAYTGTPATPEHVAGPWTVHSGTGDYELLTGSGTMLGTGVFPFLGVERWFTGTISFDATE